MINVIRYLNDSYLDSEYTTWEIRNYITWNCITRELGKLEQHTLTVL